MVPGLSERTDHGKHASSVIEVGRRSLATSKRGSLRERSGGGAQRAADDGKHASSVIEVHRMSLAINKRGRMMERSGVGRNRCADSQVAWLQFSNFFLSFYESGFEVLFLMFLMLCVCWAPKCIHTSEKM